MKLDLELIIWDVEQERRFLFYPPIQLNIFLQAVCLNLPWIRLLRWCQEKRNWRTL